MRARRPEEDEEDEEDLPWLEPARRQRGAGTLVPSRTLVTAAVLFAVLVVGILWGVRLLVEREQMRDTAFRVAAADAPLIRAPDEPYKRRPTDPGGAQIEGLDQTLYAAGGGVDPGGDIALDRVPEEPIDRSAPPAPDQPTVLLPESPGEPAGSPDSPEPTAPAAEATVQSPAAQPVVDETEGSDSEGSFSLQLGAFSSNEAAREAWKALASRYAYLAGLEPDVEKIEREGKSLFRLRAGQLSSRGRADNLCGRLKVAGEACLVVE